MLCIWFFFRYLVIMIRDIVKEVLRDRGKVLGYVKPASAFFTLEQWEYFVLRMLELQEQGFDSRGGEVSCKHATVCDTHQIHDIKNLITKANFFCSITRFLGSCKTSNVT